MTRAGMTAATIPIALAGLLALAGCSVTDAVGDATGDLDAPRVVAASPSVDTTTMSATTDETPSTTSSTTSSTTTVPPTTSTTVPAAEPEDVVANPDCVVAIAAGETILDIAERYDDETVSLAMLVSENSLTTAAPEPGTLIDICPGNAIDDVTGIVRAEGVTEEVGVIAQQEHLNVLFDGYGIAPLDVDGIAGPVTRQRLCAARLALGLPTTTAAMEPGSDEERLLFTAETLPIPDSPAVLTDRWILIDRTCQIMFVGAGTDRLEFVFPTSTGKAPFPTRDQDRSPAYRYNPASHNGGWHNSITYPAADDNPLNGNMYKPLYFDGGQAIHGANNVPRSPASHGCARLRVRDQDALLGWLGLGDLRDPIASVGRLGVTVTVQGAWAGN